MGGPIDLNERDPIWIDSMGYIGGQGYSQIGGVLVALVLIDDNH